MYPYSLDGLRQYLFNFLDTFWASAVLDPLFVLFLLLLLLIVLRKHWLSVIAGWALLTYFTSLTGNNPPVDLFFAGLLIALCLFCLTRLGLLALSALLFTSLAVNIPLSADFSVWYAPYAALSLLLLAAPAVYGYYTSLGGQPLFSGGLLED